MLPPQPHGRRFQPLARIRWPFARPTEGLQRALFPHWNVHFLSTLIIMAWYQSSPHEQRWTWKFRLWVIPGTRREGTRMVLCIMNSILAASFCRDPQT